MLLYNWHCILSLVLTIECALLKMFNSEIIAATIICGLLCISVLGHRYFMCIILFIPKDY